MPIINRQSALRAFDRRTTAEARRLSRRTCPIVGCGQAISSQYLMCPSHWARVPVAIQAAFIAPGVLSEPPKRPMLSLNTAPPELKPSTLPSQPRPQPQPQLQPPQKNEDQINRQS